MDINERYTPTTTHAVWGAGEPHLLVSRDDEHTVHRIDVDLVRIGSGTDAELHLDDIDPVHATIMHDDRDEYVLTLHGKGEMSAQSDVAATHGGERTETLRTGARFTAGPWTFVFVRDEYADHGRPFGGRQGGEYSDQAPQPPRPDYSGDASAASAQSDSSADT